MTAPSQDIPDDQLRALWRQMLGLTVVEIDRALRAAYRVGFAAALGYEITVTDAGVEIGDRGPEAGGQS